MVVDRGRVGRRRGGGFPLLASVTRLGLVVEYDKNPTRPSLKAEAMRLKSDAMHDVLDAIVEGRMDRVEAAAARMEEFAAGIEGYLATDVYEKYGEDFYGSLEELQVAAGQEDRDAAKEALLRLEQSCIDCHYLINKPGS